MTTLNPVLDKFISDANENPHVLRLLDGWDRNIALVATDNIDLENYNILVEGKRLTLSQCANDDSETITVEGDTELLNDIFTGKKNPAKEVLDGNLVVIGSDKDQMKLDAITLIMWGF